ncbi:MAG TPA: response regulator transcription factor [Bryobacteraceae bacterium]|jgi:DNA-binding NarL/FixJ family response regulator|nr:response regulator transcription factor [Bryobacteraceae bacterium]
MEKYRRFGTAQKPEAKPVSVLIVDDHPVVRDGLNAMLSADPGLQVVGEAGTGEEALAAIQRLRPSVVLMDLLLPDIEGWEVIQRVCAASSDTAFIVLTTLSGDEEIYRALEAGARGYLFKDMARKELVNAIRAVAEGKRYVPPEVGSRVAESLPRTTLSAREVDVLQCIAAGMRNKEIAFQLGVSESTVNAHIKHIMEKLHTSDRTQAVTTALRRGIIRL